MITCECGKPAIGWVDTGRGEVPACAEHYAIEEAAGSQVRLDDARARDDEDDE
jgi:hypothetical protein